MNWKFWERKDTGGPKYGAPADKRGRIAHICTHGAPPLNLVGRTPEQQAAELNAVTAAEVYLETKGVVVTPDDIRAALGPGGK